MRGFSSAFFFLACSTHARRTHRYAEANENAIATLLLAPSPSLAVRQSAASLWHRSGNHLARHQAVMQEAVVDTKTSPEAAAVVEAPSAHLPPPAPKFNVEDLAGITAPLGFFDPLGFTEGVPEGRVRFYREAEVKHGRVAMLAALGYLVAEYFHPLFDGKVDAPSLTAFQQTPLQNSFPLCFLPVAILEIFSILSFEPLSSSDATLAKSGKKWQIKSDHEPGNLGFDPFRFKPKTPKYLKDDETKELNNGRLAMIAIVGMVCQELATGTKLFG